jgi:hypothetical protein
MPRHARIVAAGFALHAILRGIDRSAIFFDDADDRALLGMLVERAAAQSVWVHDDPWSSYRCNALGVGDPVVVAHSIDCALAEGEQARRWKVRSHSPGCSSPRRDW